MESKHYEVSTLLDERISYEKLVNPVYDVYKELRKWMRPSWELSVCVSDDV